MSLNNYLIVMFGGAIVTLGSVMSELAELSSPERQRTASASMLCIASTMEFSM
jgi:hypothetical protein